MKARPVKKLDPARPLGENAARIVQVRLDEMLAFAPRALDGKAKAQHDMRIAAKRLRYVLEVTGFCFGRPADTARRRARDLQDILGEIHDCDVMLPRVRGHLKELQRADAAAVREKAGQAPDLDPRLAAQAPHRTAYRGLDVLAVYLEARRELLAIASPRSGSARRKPAPGCGWSAPSTATCGERARPAAPPRPRSVPAGRPRPPSAPPARRRLRPSRRVSTASAPAAKPSSAPSATSRPSGAPAPCRAGRASRADPCCTAGRFTTCSLRGHGLVTAIPLHKGIILRERIEREGSPMNPLPTTRVDLHCHSRASAVSKLGIQRSLGLPECATPPGEVYELAKRRGMDFVTITYHDTIDGCLELASQDDVFLSEELTAWFWDEPQAVHLLCLGITPDDHARLQERSRDLESCADYLHSHKIACSLAHPFYAVEALLTPAHRRQLAQLFPVWETRNGSRARELNMPAATYIETHGGTGTGGSDDHAGVDIGRTFTETPPAAMPEEFLRHIREGRAEAAASRAAPPNGRTPRWRSGRALPCLLEGALSLSYGGAAAEPDPEDS